MIIEFFQKIENGGRKVELVALPGVGPSVGEDGKLLLLNLV